MKVEVFGVRPYEITDKDSGEIKKGVTAHYTQKAVSNGWRGLEYGKFSVDISSAVYGTVMNMPLPAKIDVEFNRYGRVVDFEVVENV